MSSVQVGFIKWRIGTINFEIRNATQKASRYYRQNNQSRLNETLTMLEKLKAELAVWYNRLAEAEMEIDEAEMEIDEAETGSE